MIYEHISETLTPEARAQAGLDTFVNHSALRELTAYFGFQEPSDGGDRLLALQTFMHNTDWEVRNGKERQEIDWGNEAEPQNPSTPEEYATKKLFDCCRELGMVDNTYPAYEHYNFIVICKQSAGRPPALRGRAFGESRCFGVAWRWPSGMRKRASQNRYIRTWCDH